MNVQFPGVALQYSLDGKNWLTYTDNARPNVKGEVFVRSISVTGKRTSRVTSVK